jgi:hypothetical protein
MNRFERIHAERSAIAEDVHVLIENAYRAAVIAIDRARRQSLPNEAMSGVTPSPGASSSVAFPW